SLFSRGVLQNMYEPLLLMLERFYVTFLGKRSISINATPRSTYMSVDSKLTFKCLNAVIFFSLSLPFLHLS
ncbi:hypothetical protein TorRG33x02_101020, partial [Trema orientale]